MDKLITHCSTIDCINWKDGNATLIIPEHAIDIWKIDIAEQLHHINAWTLYLNEVELNKASSFRHPADKQRFIISRSVLKYLLSQIIGRKPQQVVLEYDKHKKPYLPQSTICFNVAHSGNLILIAFCKSAVGIDIEKMDAAFDYNDILDRCFAAAEIQLIKSNGHKDFYTLWSCKEAVVKLDGKGIADNMAQIVCLNSAKNINQHSSLGDIPYFVTSFIPAEHYVGSVACNQNLKINYYNFSINEAVLGEV